MCLLANLVVTRQTGPFHFAGSGWRWRGGDTSVRHFWHWNKENHLITLKQNKNHITETKSNTLFCTVLYLKQLHIWIIWPHSTPDFRHMNNTYHCNWCYHSGLETPAQCRTSLFLSSTPPLFSFSTYPPSASSTPLPFASPSWSPAPPVTGC